MQASFYILMVTLIILAAYNFYTAYIANPGHKYRSLSLICNGFAIIMCLAAILIKFFT